MIGKKILVLRSNVINQESELKRLVIVDRIETTDFAQLARNVQGIFINLDIGYIDEVLQKLKDTEFAKQFINNGLVFIWADKTRICEIIDLMEEKRFNYVENIVFSVFNPDKIIELTKTLAKQITGRKTVLEGFYKIQNDPVSSKKLEYLDLIRFLRTAAFVLPDGDSVEKYLLKFPSEFAATNKRTLLVFRRVK